MARVWARLSGYGASPDPLTQRANTLALVLASNQPIYPLYVAYAVGELAPLLILTMLSTPFFLLSPWITRRFPVGGRLYFPVVGAVNTLFCGAVFGHASGVEAFLVPCLVIAALSCRPKDRPAFGITLLLLYATMILGREFALGAIIPYNPEQLSALARLNAYSAASFSVLAAWSLTGAQGEVGGGTSMADAP